MNELSPILNVASFGRFDLIETNASTWQLKTMNIAERILQSGELTKQRKVEWIWEKENTWEY